MRAFAAFAAALFCGLSASSAFAAGDVNVVLAKKGELQLWGDDLANDVQISRDQDTKEFVVTGRSGTTVNGVDSVRLVGVRSIRATMNGGDDVLAMGGFNLKGFVNVDMGDGNDTVSLVDMIVVGRVIVRGGDGDDAVSILAGCDLRSGGYVDAGEGANHVAISDSYVRGPTKVLGGGGGNLIEIHRAGFTSDASLSIKTGSGDDTVDFLGNTFQCPVQALTGYGVDTINVATSGFSKAVGMNAGDGDDNVNIDRCTFRAKFFISGGKGTNKAGVSNVNGAAFSSGGLVFAGGYGHSGHFYWAFIVVNVF
jgi:hypothetical protein